MTWKMFNAAFDHCMIATSMAMVFNGINQGDFQLVWGVFLLAALTLIKAFESILISVGHVHAARLEMLETAAQLRAFDCPDSADFLTSLALNDGPLVLNDPLNGEQHDRRH